MILLQKFFRRMKIYISVNNIFQNLLKICLDFDKLRIQGRMQFFEKMSQDALNQVLTLPDYRTQKMLQIPLKFFDLQNDFIILVAKRWTTTISVPMSYLRLFENLAVLEKRNLKGT